MWAHDGHLARPMLRGLVNLGRGGCTGASPEPGGSSSRTKIVSAGCHPESVGIYCEQRGWSHDKRHSNTAVGWIVRPSNCAPASSPQGVGAARNKVQNRARDSQNNRATRRRTLHIDNDKTLRPSSWCGQISTRKCYEDLI